MKILREFRISEVAEAFNTKYPYLKIKFYWKEHEHFQGSPQKEEISSNLKLSEVNSSLENGEIELADTLTVDQLESIFEDEFGLHAQVFRKSGDTWLQTSMTDHWTLGKHMEKAASSVKSYNSSH